MKLIEKLFNKMELFEKGEKVLVISKEQLYKMYGNPGSDIVEIFTRTYCFRLTEDMINLCGKLCTIGEVYDHHSDPFYVLEELEDRNWPGVVFFKLSPEIKSALDDYFGLLNSAKSYCENWCILKSECETKCPLKKLKDK